MLECFKLGADYNIPFSYKRLHCAKIPNISDFLYCKNKELSMKKSCSN